MFKKLFKFQRDRDEKLVDRLQKKLTDPTSPSNSPMVKKLKVNYFFCFSKVVSGPIYREVSHLTKRYDAR